MLNVSLTSPQDELTMDNISRSGLVNMCRYMGLPPFGNDNFLRYCLRSKLRAITQARRRLIQATWRCCENGKANVSCVAELACHPRLGLSRESRLYRTM